MAPSGGWFCRNERVQKYVPQVLSKYACITGLPDSRSHHLLAQITGGNGTPRLPLAHHLWVLGQHLRTGWSTFSRACCLGRGANHQPGGIHHLSCTWRVLLSLSQRALCSALVLAAHRPGD